MSQFRPLLIWIDWNVEHIGRHGVLPEEAQFIVDHPAKGYPQQSGEGKILVRGRTSAGRFLQVIFIELDDEDVNIEDLNLMDRMRLEEGAQPILVIHARPLTEREKRQLQK